MFGPYVQQIKNSDYDQSCYNKSKNRAMKTAQEYRQKKCSSPDFKMRQHTSVQQGEYSLFNESNYSIISKIPMKNRNKKQSDFSFGVLGK